MTNDEAPKAKINFNRAIDGVVGENADQFFKNNLVRILKSSSTVNSISESEALRSLRGRIAESEGPIEVNSSNLDLLESNINRALQNEGTRIPNKLVEEIVDLIQNGKEQIAEQREEGD